MCCRGGSAGIIARMSQEPNQPFFTIAIPTFNRAGLLERCIRAALNQTFDDYEVLVADNCSADETPEVVKRFSDPRLRYVRHEKNLGAIGNFRYATDAARGRFLVLNQDDDLLHRDFLRRCHAAVNQRPDVVAYVCSLWRGTDTHGYSASVAPDPAADWMQCIVNDRPHIMPGVDIVVSLLYIFHYVHPGVAYHTQTFREVGGIPDDMVGTVDLIAEARLFCRGDVAVDPWPGVVYSEHGENMSRKMTKAQKRQCRLDLYGEVMRVLEAAGYDWRRRLAELLEPMTEDQIAWVMREWVRNGAPGVMHRELWKALRKRYAGKPRRMWRLMTSRMGPRKSASFLLQLLKSR
jgi:glycosyltransferase involved in cell wall biosynthesis